MLCTFLDHSKLFNNLSDIANNLIKICAFEESSSQDMGIGKNSLLNHIKILTIEKP